LSLIERLLSMTFGLLLASVAIRLITGTWSPANRVFLLGYAVVNISWLCLAALVRYWEHKDARDEPSSRC